VLSGAIISVMQNVPPAYSDGEWGRLPKASHVIGQPGARLRGLSRTTLLELGAAGHIKIIGIRKPGSQKAIRLVHLPTLDQYLASLALEGNEGGGTRGKKSLIAREARAK
jgi:hypothetical protein